MAPTTNVRPQIPPWIVESQADWYGVGLTAMHEVFVGGDWSDYDDPGVDIAPRREPVDT